MDRNKHLQGEVELLMRLWILVTVLAIAQTSTVLADDANPGAANASTKLTTGLVPLHILAHLSLDPTRCRCGDRKLPLITITSAKTEAQLDTPLRRSHSGYEEIADTTNNPWDAVALTMLDGQPTQQKTAGQSLMVLITSDWLEADEYLVPAQWYRSQQQDTLNLELWTQTARRETGPRHRSVWLLAMPPGAAGQASLTVNLLAYQTRNPMQGYQTGAVQTGTLRYEHSSASGLSGAPLSLYQSELKPVPPPAAAPPLSGFTEQPTFFWTPFFHYLVDWNWQHSMPPTNGLPRDPRVLFPPRLLVGSLDDLRARVPQAPLPPTTKPEERYALLRGPLLNGDEWMAPTGLSWTGDTLSLEYSTWRNDWVRLQNTFYLPWLLVKLGPLPAGVTKIQARINNNFAPTVSHVYAVDPARPSVVINP